MKIRNILVNIAVVNLLISILLSMVGKTTQAIHLMLIVIFTMLWLIYTKNDTLTNGIRNTKKGGKLDSDFRITKNGTYFKSTLLKNILYKHEQVEQQYQDYLKEN